MQRFGFLCASSPRFFIGYWILQRGWVSTRPLFINTNPSTGYEGFRFEFYHRFKLPLLNCHSGVYKG